MSNQEGQQPASSAAVSCSSLALALRYDPFYGDMDGESRTLQDKIVKARKLAECHQCSGVITPGQLIRSRRDVFEGEFMSFRWCQTCTELMALDDHDALEARCRTNSKLNEPSSD